MNKIVWLMLSIFMLSSCTTPVIERNAQGKMPRLEAREAFDGMKKKVAILNFFNESPYGGEAIANVATEELKRELDKTNEFIIDPISSKSFGSSKEIYAGGGMKFVQLSRKAKTEGVNFILFGRVVDARVREKTDEIGLIRQTSFYVETKVEVRLYDVNSSKELMTIEMSGYADDKLFRVYNENKEERETYRSELMNFAVRLAVDKLVRPVQDLSRKLDWTGRVAKIIGVKIYLNAGRVSGINIGDILKVITEGQEIYDPETGALIGISKGEIKGTIEVIDFFGPDGSIAVLHSGGTVLEGDYVQLY